MVPADLGRDRHEATDLIVFTARDHRTAARVRRPGYVDKFRDRCSAGEEPRHCG
jgi:hypothetical protein